MKNSNLTQILLYVIILLFVFALAMWGYGNQESNKAKGLQEEKVALKQRIDDMMLYGNKSYNFSREEYWVLETESGIIVERKYCGDWNVPWKTRWDVGCRLTQMHKNNEMGLHNLTAGLEDKIHWMDYHHNETKAELKWCEQRLELLRQDAMECTQKYAFCEWDLERCRYG